MTRRCPPPRSLAGGGGSLNQDLYRLSYVHHFCFPSRRLETTENGSVDVFPKNRPQCAVSASPLMYEETHTYYSAGAPVQRGRNLGGLLFSFCALLLGKAVSRRCSVELVTLYVQCCSERASVRPRPSLCQHQRLGMSQRKHITLPIPLHTSL